MASAPSVSSGHPGPRAGVHGPTNASLAPQADRPHPAPLRAAPSPLERKGPAASNGGTGGGDTLAIYLAARAASGNAPAAARAYAAVLAADPDPVVAIRAYRAAVTSGDLGLAARAAAILAAAKVAPDDAALLPITAAARANDAVALAGAAQSLAGTPLAILVPALTAWTHYAADGVIPPADDPDATARRLLAETRALLLLAAGRTEEGLAAISATGRPPLDLRVAAAQLLAGQGKSAPARALVAGDDPVLARLRDGVAAEATLAFGTSRLLARVAGDLDGAATVPLRIALTRAALEPDPRFGRARLLLAAALAEAGDADLAIAELSVIAPDSPWYPAAADARVAILAGTDRSREALGAARVVAASGGAPAWERYAGLLVGAGRPAEAIPWYRRLVDGPDKASWQSWAALGNALDLAGHWAEAKRALDRAVALAPDEPLALNNAGYARLDHGERREGTRLLERAARLAPDDTSIADSLGWAYHLSGDQARALPLIERAARAQPGNAEIADHLGDVYWRLGRRYEARYAWAAARLVAPAAEGRALAAKIENGL